MAKHIAFTRSGSKMNPALKSRVINLLLDPENDQLSQKELATKLGIAPTTLRNYQTAELLDYVRQQRQQHCLRLLAAVDYAMVEKASKGDVAAAKLVYARWEAQQQSALSQAAEPPVDVETLSEAELDKRIAELLVQLNEVTNAR